jgi:hypothetical protein
LLASAAIAAATLAMSAPVVVHDSRERFPLASVAAAPLAVPGAGADRHPAVYGRAVPSERGGEWLQYWLFYPGQDQDRGIVRTGRHAGDWEMVQYRVEDGGRIAEAVYAQHSGGERCRGAALQMRDGRPVVYVAHGSHASYARPGTRDRLWPDPNDEADGRGRVVTPRLVVVTASSPASTGAAPGPAGGSRVSTTRRAGRPSSRRSAGANRMPGPRTRATARPRATASTSAMARRRRSARGRSWRCSRPAGWRCCGARGGGARRRPPRTERPLLRLHLASPSTHRKDRGVLLRSAIGTGRLPPADPFHEPAGKVPVIPAAGRQDR